MTDDSHRSEQEEADAFLFDSDSDELSAWPATSDDLRASDGQERDQAVLQWWPGYEGRLIGFRRAAEILAPAMLNAPDHRDLDTVVYPFLNCWRHYVELHLKYLIARCQKVAGKPDTRRGGHKILQLWNELVPLMRSANLPKDPEESQVVKHLITQLDNLDPDNQEFRYAQRRDGTPTLADVRNLDVRSFHNAMLGVANYFEATDTALHEIEEVRREMAREGF